MSGLQRLLAQLRNPASILRLIATLFSLIALVLLIVAYPKNDYFYSDGDGTVFNSMPFGAIALSVLWNSIALLLTFTLGPYHPGVDIALDFLAWGLAWAMGFLLLAWAGSLDPAASCEYRLDNGRASYVRDCGEASLLKVLEVAAGVLIVIAGTCHLVIFVMACKDTDALRKRKRDSFVELGEMDGQGKELKAGRKGRSEAPRQ